MRFLVDENVRESVVELLRSLGYDARSVVEALASATDDESILAYAAKEQRILITNDQDFGTLTFLGMQPSCGVILLRLQRLAVDVVHHRLQQTLLEYDDRCEGHFIVIEDHRVRIRSLPA